jgi:cytochrome c oxidase subunit 2
MRGRQNRVTNWVAAWLAKGMAAAGIAAAAVLAPIVAFAAPNGPDGQINLSTPASNKMAEIVWFHNYLLILITAICIFVLALLVYVCWRFAEKRNPTPSRLTHHAGLEVAWTIIPVLILVVVAIPSFRIMRDQLVIPPADVTLKITGKQWFWTWEYPKDGGGFTFDQIMLDDKQKRIRVIVPNLMGYDAGKLPATYHAFYDPATGVAQPNDGRPVHAGLRPEFVWPAGA